MLLPRHESESSSKRDDDGSASKAGIIVVVALAILIAVAAFVYITLKILRNRNASPKYLPTKYLKRKWEAWSPTKLTSKGLYTAQLHDNDSVPTLHSRSARGSTIILADPERAASHGGSADAAVDRHASVRSVMTLPTYSKSVRENEQVLGREGERAGVDVVVEQPETAAEEEDRREEEMETLYQIRMQRRREIADRETRRQERRDARARGDSATLERLRQESALRAQEREVNGAAVMMAEHRSRSRDRRVSSVSYADLGVARHDGTRIRTNSTESERPLLDSAASIATRSTRRARSTSSAHSVSDASDIDALPPFGRAGNDFEIVTMNQPHSHNASRTPTPLGNRSRASSHTRPVIDTSVDLGDRTIPISDPPAYDGEGFEEAPPYTSPVQARPRPSPIEESPRDPRASMRFSASGAPVLPQLGPLPSIHIAAATPIEPRRSVEWPESSRDVVEQSQR